MDVQTVSANGINVPCHFLVHQNNYIYFMGLISRSQISLNSVLGTIHLGESLSIERESFYTKGEYRIYREKIHYGKEVYYTALIMKEEFTKKGILCETLTSEIVYNKLLSITNIPLLGDWKDYIYRELLSHDCIRELTVSGEYPGINGKFYELKTDDNLIRLIIRDGLIDDKIRLTDKPQIKLQCDDLNEYFIKYGSYLSDSLKDYIKPVSDGTGELDIKTYNKTLLDSQRITTRGMVDNFLQRSKTGILVGEMGVGKTLISPAVIEQYFFEKYKKSNSSLTWDEFNRTAAYRVAVIGPSHITEKWAIETYEEFYGADVYLIDNMDKVYELANKRNIKPEGKEYYIFSKDFFKLGYPLYPGIKTEAVRNVKHASCCGLYQFGDRERCPECGLALRYQTKRCVSAICPDCGKPLIENGIKHKTTDSECMPVPVNNYVLDFMDFDTMKKTNYSCFHCGATLWTGKTEKTGWVKVKKYLNKASTNTVSRFINKKHLKDSDVLVADNRSSRIAPSIFFKKRLRKGFFDLLVADEAHKFEAGFSAQAHAFHVLCGLSRKRIILTGTLVGGYAKDVFHILYKLKPYMMKSKGFNYDDERKFSEEYGVIETVSEANDFNTVYNTTSRGGTKKRTKVLPGISINLYKDFLIEDTVYLNMSDLSDALPSFKEVPVPVQMNDEVCKAYNRSKGLFKDYLFKERISSRMLNVLLSWVDKPLKVDIYSPASGKLLFDLPDLMSGIEADDKLLPKEEMLLDITKKSLKENRNVFIYAEFTNTEDKNILPRLQKIISENVTDKVAVLTQSIPAKKRKRHLESLVNKGIKIIIGNYRLVETGLDIIDYPTIIYFQTGYSLFSIYQASRRAYRIIQDRDCLVYYLYYADTLQEKVIELYAKKKAAASTLQGNLTAEGLEMLSCGERTEDVLVNSVSENMENFDIVGAFTNANKLTAEGAKKLAGTGSKEEGIPDIKLKPVLGSKNQIKGQLSLI
jgi:superfamily II DNA or RNA helicase/predicted RNA-binding Zn-ribbon protein involved in translation (DUF1610 family)